MDKNSRAKYTSHMKQLVRDKYPLCRTLEDKEELARELGMDSIHKLYNLASRLQVTRSYDDWDAEDADMPFGDRYDPTKDEQRLWQREDPKTTKFSAEDDRYLEAHFGRTPIDQIAFHREHTETATLYRARQLGLCKPVRYWDIRKVSPWLGMSVGELQQRSEEGLDIYPLCDREGRIQIQVVSTTSIARWIISHDKELVERDADKFFIKDIKEQIKALQKEEVRWESCIFLGAGHVCRNPFSGVYGMFCTNTERHRAGEDPKCSVRTLHIEDLRPR
jgi:hypothetical protein